MKNLNASIFQQKRCLLLVPSVYSDQQASVFMTNNSKEKIENKLETNNQHLENQSDEFSTIFRTEFI